MNILKYPNPILKQKCNPVQKMGKKFRESIHDMIELLHSTRGLGLSAPQVGIDEQFFVWNYYPSVVVNPTITRRKGNIGSEEGCLSLIYDNEKEVPVELYKWAKVDKSGRVHIIREVQRPEEIWVEGYDYKGREFNLRYKGLPAIIFSHEYQHILGKLIIDN